MLLKDWGVFQAAESFFEKYMLRPLELENVEVGLGMGQSLRHGLGLGSNQIGMAGFGP